MTIIGDFVIAPIFYQQSLTEPSSLPLRLYSLLINEKVKT